MPAGSCGAGPHAPRPRTSLRLRRSQCPRSGPAAGKERVERGPQRACRPERDLRAKAARGCTGVETQSVGTGARLLVPEQRRVDVVRGRDQADARACGQLAEQRLRARRAQPCARRPGSRSEGATGVPSHVSTPQRRPQAATRAGARRAKHAGSPLPLKRTPPATQAGQPAAQDGARPLRRSRTAAQAGKPAAQAGRGCGRAGALNVVDDDVHRRLGRQRAHGAQDGLAAAAPAAAGPPGSGMACGVQALHGKRCGIARVRSLPPPAGDC